MMSKYLLLFFIPALYARINVRITAGRTEADVQVQFTGSDIEIISDRERETFQIVDRDLKKACLKLSGRKPTHVYVRSPKAWKDVYLTNNWKQVKRTLKPVRSRVIRIHTTPIIVATREFESYSKVKAKFNAAIGHSVEETVTNSFTTGGELTVGHEITYNVNFPSDSVEGTNSLSYTESWGNETSKVKSVTLGTSPSDAVELSPYQSVVATLSAIRNILEIEIDYEAHLIGYVAANYRHRLQNHRFWAFPVKWLLKAASLPQYINSTEKISIGFYTSARVVISDRKTSRAMKFISAGIITDPDTISFFKSPNYVGNGRKTSDEI